MAIFNQEYFGLCESTAFDRKKGLTSKDMLDTKHVSVSYTGEPNKNREKDLVQAARLVANGDTKFLKKMCKAQTGIDNDEYIDYAVNRTKRAAKGALNILKDKEKKRLEATKESFDNFFLENKAQEKIAGIYDKYIDNQNRKIATAKSIDPNSKALDRAIMRKDDLQATASHVTGARSSKEYAELQKKAQAGDVEARDLIRTGKRNINRVSNATKFRDGNMYINDDIVRKQLEKHQTIDKKMALRKNLGIDDSKSMSKNDKGDIKFKKNAKEREEAKNRIKTRELKDRLSKADLHKHAPGVVDAEGNYIPFVK